MVPIYEQVVNQIKNDIIDGTLKENDPLPSVRALSSSLKISALTVKKAYDKLEEDGFVHTIHGKGTYVASADTSLANEARKKALEDEFYQVIQKALSMGLSKEEIQEIFSIIMED